jgi:hypothetical protein
MSTMSILGEAVLSEAVTTTTDRIKPRRGRH